MAQQLLNKRDKTINQDGVLAFAQDTRAAVEDIIDRLDKEITGVIDDFHTNVEDPQAAPTVASMQRVRTLADDARERLRALAGACQEMGTTVTT